MIGALVSVLGLLVVLGGILLGSIGVATGGWIQRVDCGTYFSPDYREARDIVLRRSKETIRGPLNCDPWRGVVPGQFIAMEDDNPKFKGARALSRDLMSPSFLHSVRIPDLVRRRT